MEVEGQAEQGAEPEGLGWFCGCGLGPITAEAPEIRRENSDLNSPIRATGSFKTIPMRIK